MRLLHILIFLAFTKIVAGSSDSYTDAMSYLRQNASSLGVSDDDLSELSVSSAHFDQSTGLHHIYVQQGHRQYAVEGALANLIRLSDGKIRVVTHNLVSGLNKIPNQQAVLSGEDVLRISAQSIRSNKRVSNNSRIHGMMWSQTAGGWHLVYDVRLETEDHYWRLWISATEGTIIKKKDLMLNCSFGDRDISESQCNHQVQDISPANSFGVNESYVVYPTPIESPYHGTRQLIISPADDIASPFGWHDIDGMEGSDFTDTRGNNVYAQNDPVGNDIAVTRPDAGISLSFNFNLDLKESPILSADAAVTNLFYWNNINHDIFYHFGFDEVAGNFQVNNYGRGGLEGDPVYADAQDGSDRNNARFFVAEDGLPARMQMYLWTSNLYDAAIQIKKRDGSFVTIDAVESGFSFNNKLHSRDLNDIEIVRVQDASGSTHLGCLEQAISNAPEIRGKIALVDRGQCFFVEKVNRLEELGALAVVVCNNVPESPIIMGGDDQSITIPAVMISIDQCSILENLLVEGDLQTSIRSQNDPGALDSALDNLIITHEYGHGISTRLVGGANQIGCLDNAEQMGEGWSDYFGLMLTTDWTTAQAGDPRGIGTFVSNQSKTGRGLRNYPYSTDRSINPMIYDDVKVSPLTHAVGAIWCAMLWDMTWNIIETEEVNPDVYSDDGGNNIALKLVVEGLKLLNCYPGFTDGRDAILLADSLLYSGQHQFQIWKAFAGRGLGILANQGSSYNTFDGRSNFDLPENFKTAILSFSAVEQGDHIDLDFTTLQEYDNLEFNLQRSTDQISFTTIQSYEGKILESNPRTFHYEDFDVTEGNIYYYRILNKDISLIENILGQDSAFLIPVSDLLIFPNPSSGVTSVKISREHNGPVKLNLYNVTGQLIWEEQTDAENLYTRHQLNFDHLTPGVYLLDCTVGQEHYRRRIMLH